MPPPDAQQRLYLMEIAKHALNLREALVRRDENLPAWQVLDALPEWLLEASDELSRAHAEQREMVLHLIDPNEYARYYATNPHERPFEVQYGIPVTEAWRLPRVGWLHGQLIVTFGDPGTEPRISLADLGCNDGWMLNYLEHAHPRIRGPKVGVDLNPDCIQRAKTRGIKVIQGAAEDAPDLLVRGDVTTYRMPARFDAVTIFEVVEHVLNPDHLIHQAARLLKPEGRLYISCPNGPIEHGWLPNWNQVERKGHVRTLNPKQLRELVERADLEPLSAPMFPDGTMAIEARKP